MVISTLASQPFDTIARCRRARAVVPALLAGQPRHDAPAARSRAGRRLSGRGVHGRCAGQADGAGLAGAGRRGQSRRPRARSAIADGQSQVFDGWMAQAPTWDDLAWLRDQTSLPLLLKGVLHADDAVRAVRLGATGSWCRITAGGCWAVRRPVCRHCRPSCRPSVRMFRCCWTAASTAAATCTARWRRRARRAGRTALHLGAGGKRRARRRARHPPDAR
jgi:hypothetical protein